MPTKDTKVKKVRRSTQFTTSGYSSGATATQAVHPVPASIVGVRTYIECVQAMTFSAGTTTGCTMLVGIGSDTDYYATSANIGAMTAGQKILLTAGVAIAALDGTARDVIATLTATGGTPNCNQINGGLFIIHQEYEVAPDAVH